MRGDDVDTQTTHTKSVPFPIEGVVQCRGDQKRTQCSHPVVTAREYYIQYCGALPRLFRRRNCRRQHYDAVVSASSSKRANEKREKRQSLDFSCHVRGTHPAIFMVAEKNSGQFVICDEHVVQGEPAGDDGADDLKHEFTMMGRNFATHAKVITSGGGKE